MKQAQLIISHSASKFILALFLLSALTGCATTGPGIKYYEDHKDSSWLKDSAANFRSNMKRVPAVGSRRIMVRVFSWNDVPNAFVNFDNRYVVISISDSLLPYLTGNNIYCLLAHECAHVEFNHQGTKAGISALISATVLLADCAVPGYGIGLLDPLSQSVVVTAYSRKDEIDADTRALDYLAGMGISNEDYVSFLKLVKSIQPALTQGGGIFDTHPNYNERIINAENKKVPINSNKSEVMISAKQEEEQEAKAEALKIKEIKNRFAFDIGPYGEAKATKLTQGLTERDVIALFDGFGPNEKIILTNGPTVWAYNIAGTKYRFFILMQKDSAGINRVANFTIDSADNKLDKVKFN
jgi:Zn-dependent protease with chaperone function